MKRNSSKKKAVLLLLAAMLIFSISSSVSAESDLPDPEIKGSITVHKYAAAAESQTPGTGQEQQAEDAAELGTPLKGVGFTLYKVSSEIPVTHTTTPEDAKAGAEIVGGGQKLTDENGTVSWTNLDIGYYVLSETKTLNGYQTSPESIIRLPIGITVSGSEEKWNYDIHVYPKNIKNADLSKEVFNEMALYSAGETAWWRIDSKIQKTLYDPQDPSYGSFRIIDPLDSRLSYVNGSDKLIATGGTNSPMVMVRDTDYEVKQEDGTVIWEFTNEGMRKFTESESKAVSLTFATTLDLDAVDASSGSGRVISNNATAEYRAFSEAEETTLTIDEEDVPYINLAGIVIKKVDSKDTEILLDGAEFKIALSESDARNGIYIKNPRTNNDVIAVTGDSPETAGTEQGWAIITGLPANPESDAAYYLVEVAPPEGYVLRQSIIEVTIEKGKKTAVAEILNQKIGDPPIDEDVPTFILPPTGGIGTLVFVAGGWTLIGLALLLFFKRRKDEDEKKETQSR